MNIRSEIENPFTVTTPEGMKAEKVVQLFVDVFSDFPKVPREGHVFIHGPRGSGKSMMFRYLQPDCQQIVRTCSLSQLGFYSIYIPLKNTDLKLTELKRLEDKHATFVLNEHFMTLAITQAIFNSLSELKLESYPDVLNELKDFGKDTFFRLLRNCGWTNGIDNSLTRINTTEQFIKELSSINNTLFIDVVNYLKRLSFTSEVIQYNGPLCGYMDFLYPMLCKLKELSFMPKGPIFLLIDDADNLNLTQTKILNSWVASRTSSQVSIKISTQMQYKTFRTATGQSIDTMHDFAEINISTIYTSSHKDKYRERVWSILSKRLNSGDKIEVKPEEYFPADKAQEKAIKKIADQYRKQWQSSGRGFRPSDDATRYARPDFFKGLAGKSKSTPSYSYAGFEQLVHISSGIIRYFLEPAAAMYSETFAENDGKPVKFIPPTIQDKVIKRQSYEFLFNEFDKMRNDEDEEALNPDIVSKLYNLINALGGTFRLILLSDRAERRVFSIAFSDEPTKEILDVLHTGVRLGYFHLSSIGNKDGTGRTPLYILSRRLAPHFNLDPTSFAGYLFVTTDRILEAMSKPSTLLRRIKMVGLDSVFDDRQLKLHMDKE
jgi:hypothetical protein